MDNLGRVVLTGSGAVGTYLRDLVGHNLASVELLNVDNPDAVYAMHQEYKKAGAQILVTNTFAANRLALAEFGRENELVTINHRAVEIAREIAGSDCLVWASVGPAALGFRLDDYSDAQIAELYRAQCEALRGADAIVLETHSVEREARGALKGAAAAGLPVIFQLGTLPQGAVRWQRAQALVKMAVDAGVVAIGANCSHQHQIVRTIEYIAGLTDLPITAAPNAGSPDFERGHVFYRFSPQDLLRVGKTLVTAGASVVGGCCGTTPEHIAALAPALSGRPVASRTARPAVVVTERRAALEPSRPNRIRRLMQDERFLISVEIRPNRQQSLASIVEGARAIAAAGVDMFDVPDNAAATVGRDSMVTAAELQRELGVPSMSHKTVSQSNALHLHSELIGCWDLGLDGVLVITGDVPNIGHMASIATRVADLRSSVELLRLVSRLRTGSLVTGDSLADPPDFCAGCGMGSARGLKPQVKWLQKKIEAGAEFVFTQPVFTLDQFQRLCDEVAPLNIRLFPGIMPLVGLKNAQFLASGRIPGIEVPENIVSRFEAFSSPDDQRKFGLQLVTELAMNIRAAGARGIYVIMPFGKHSYPDTAGVVRALRAADSR